MGDRATLQQDRAKDGPKSLNDSLDQKYDPVVEIYRGFGLPRHAVRSQSYRFMPAGRKFGPGGAILFLSTLLSCHKSLS